MSEYNKPLPDPKDPGTAPFWTATHEHKLVAQKCASCGYVRWPPGPVCPECQTPGEDWAEIRPTGTLYSTAIYHRPLARSFKDDIPYTVGMIELDDGPRMYGIMVGESGLFALDAPVRAVFFDATPEVTLVHWEMVP